MKRYPDIDFGIGIDHGKILATKVGVGGDDETKDLIWIGNAVNKSTKISDKCKSDYNIGISKSMYNNLTDDVKYVIKEGIFGEYNKDIWESGFSDYIEYDGEEEAIYTTKYHCEIK